MRILFLTDNFPPEVNAPASRTVEHARYWVRNGVDVTVITCAPNFPRGEVHKGYKNSWRKIEVIDGIRVVRVKTFISKNQGFLLRILDYVSFMFSAFLFGLFEKRPDVIIGTSPQFFTAVGAWMLSVFKRCPFVFELRDIWPASIVTVGAMEPGFFIRMLEKLELFLYRRAAVIISVTDSFVEDLARRNIDRKKIKVVRNGVDLQRFKPLPYNKVMAIRLGVEHKFVISYVGTHGMAHGLFNVIEAAAKMPSESDIVFLLVGDGAEKSGLVKEAKRLELANVVFCDSLPKSEMPGVWSITDVALVHLKNDPVFKDVIPSKIFEAFGSAKPILIAQPKGEAVDIVRSAGAGEWVPPQDPAALVAASLKIRSDDRKIRLYGLNARKAASENCREKLASRMLGILQEL